MITSLGFRQIFDRKDETLDSLSLCDCRHDLRHIRYRDAAVEKMLRLDQNGDAGGTLIQATCSAGARLPLCQTTRFELILQCPMHRFRTTRRARAFLIAIGAPIGANKEISLPLRHGAGWQQLGAWSTAG